MNLSLLLGVVLNFLIEAAAELLAIEMVEITLPKTTEDLECISQEQQSMAQVESLPLKLVNLFLSHLLLESTVYSSKSTWQWRWRSTG